MNEKDSGPGYPPGQNPVTLAFKAAAQEHRRCNKSRKSISCPVADPPPFDPQDKRQMHRYGETVDQEVGMLSDKGKGIQSMDGAFSGPDTPMQVAKRAMSGSGIIYVPQLESPMQRVVTGKRQDTNV